MKIVDQIRDLANKKKVNQSLVTQWIQNNKAPNPNPFLVLEDYRNGIRLAWILMCAALLGLGIMLHSMYILNAKPEMWVFVVLAIMTILPLLSLGLTYTALRLFLPYLEKFVKDVEILDTILVLPNGTSDLTFEEIQERAAPILRELKLGIKEEFASLDSSLMHFKGFGTLDILRCFHAFGLYKIGEEPVILYGIREK